MKAVRHFKQKTLPILGRIYVTMRVRNVIFSLTDMDGRVMGHSSVGRMGVSGSKRKSALLAQECLEKFVQEAFGKGFRLAHIVFKGYNNSREKLFQSLYHSKLELKSLSDVNRVPFGGCKVRKRKR